MDSYLERDSNTSRAWASAPILWVQMEMIMLIQHAEKKQNSPSFEMDKWIFGITILVTDWKDVPATFYFICIEIPDDAQTNAELYTFSNFFNQGTNLYFDSRNIYKLSNVYVLLLLLMLQTICQIGYCWDIEGALSKNVSAIYMIYLMY